MREFEVMTEGCDIITIGSICIIISTLPLGFPLLSFIFTIILTSFPYATPTLRMELEPSPRILSPVTFLAHTTNLLNRQISPVIGVWIPFPISLSVHTLHLEPLRIGGAGGVRDFQSPRERERQYGV